MNTQYIKQHLSTLKTTLARVLNFIPFVKLSKISNNSTVRENWVTAIPLQIFFVWVSRLFYFMANLCRITQQPRCSINIDKFTSLPRRYWEPVWKEEHPR